MSDGDDDAARNIPNGRPMTVLPPSPSIPAKRKQATIEWDDEIPTWATSRSTTTTTTTTTTRDVDNNTIRCICGSTTDDGLSIACDICERWCHAACFDIVLGEIPEEWRCWECSPRPVDRERAARLQTERLPGLLEAQRAQHEQRQRDGHGRAEGSGGDRGRRKGSPGTDKKQRRTTTVDGSTSKRRRRLSVAQPPATTPTTTTTTPTTGTGAANATASGEDELLDIEESWAQSYVHISEDIITSEETRQRLHHQAQQWRGVTALASDTPRTTIRPLDPKLAVHPALSSAANLDARTPVYAVHTTAPVAAESLITPYTSVLTPSSAYVSDSLNGYALMGHPKPFVHLIGAPFHLALDARMAGNESRFVRSGCKPNAVIRPLLCEPDSSTLRFGVFASRDLKENEEVVLGWEWDDGNVVHSLPAIIEDPGMFTNRWGAPRRPEEVHHVKKQVANILHTLGSTFTTCACGARARDCAFTVMAEFVNDEERLATGTAMAAGAGAVVTAGAVGVRSSSPVVVPYAIRRKPDVGALLGVGKKRGFLARERVPWSGGMGGVEEVVVWVDEAADHGHGSDASTSTSASALAGVPIVRVEPASPLRRTPSLKGKERAMDVDGEGDHGGGERDGESGSERVRSISNGKHVSFDDESVLRRGRGRGRRARRREGRSSSSSPPPSDERDLRPPDPPDDEGNGMRVDGMQVDDDDDKDDDDDGGDGGGEEEATEDEEYIPPTLPMMTEDLMPPKLRKKWIHRALDELRERGPHGESGLVVEEDRLGGQNRTMMQGVDEKGSGDLASASEDITTPIGPTTTVPPANRQMLEPPSTSPSTSFAKLSLISPPGTGIVHAGAATLAVPDNTKRWEVGASPRLSPPDVIVLDEEEQVEPSGEVEGKGRGEQNDQNGQGDGVEEGEEEEVELEYLPLEEGEVSREEQQQQQGSPRSVVDLVESLPGTPTSSPAEAGSVATTGAAATATATTAATNTNTTTTSKKAAPVLVRHPNSQFMNVVLGASRGRDVDSVASTPRMGEREVLEVGSGSGSSVASTPAASGGGDGVEDGDVDVDVVMGEVREEEGGSEEGKGDGDGEQGDGEQGGGEHVRSETGGSEQEGEERAKEVDQQEEGQLQQEREQQPPPAKVKLSLKDFALRKRKQREEEQKAHRVEEREDGEIRSVEEDEVGRPSVVDGADTVNGGLPPGISLEVKQELVRTALESDAAHPSGLRGEPARPGFVSSRSVSSFSTTPFSPPLRHSSMSIASLVSPPLRNIEPPSQRYQQPSSIQGPNASTTPIPPTLPAPMSVSSPQPASKPIPISRSSTIEDDTVSLGESDDDMPHAHFRPNQDFSTTAPPPPPSSRPPAPIPSRPSTATIPDRPRNLPSAPFTFRQSVGPPRTGLPLPPIPPVTTHAMARKGLPTGPATKPFSSFLPAKPAVGVPPPGGGYTYMSAMSMAPRSGNGISGGTRVASGGKPIPSGPAALRQHDYGGGVGSGSSGGSYTRDQSTATPTPPPTSAASSAAYSNSTGSTLGAPPLSSASSTSSSSFFSLQSPSMSPWAAHQLRIPTAPRIHRPPVERPGLPRRTFPPPPAPGPAATPVSVSSPPLPPPLPPAYNSTYMPSYSHGPGEKWPKSRVEEPPPLPRRDMRVGPTTIVIPEYQRRVYPHENGSASASASASAIANGRKPTLVAPYGSTATTTMGTTYHVQQSVGPSPPAPATASAAGGAGMPPREPRAHRVANYMAEQKKQQKQQQQGPGV